MSPRFIHSVQSPTPSRREREGGGGKEEEKGRKRRGRGRGKRSRKGRREEEVEGKMRDEAEERHGIEEVWNESTLDDSQRYHVTRRMMT